MSAASLLAWVSTALALQLAVALAVVLLRRNRAAAARAAAPRPVLPATGAWQGWREFRVARRDDEDRARTLCSFHLEPLDGVPLPPFVPGQFLTFTLPVTSERASTRCYSLSDGPNARSYRITVKRVPGGTCSNYLHDRLQVGDVVKVKAPAGRFVVEGEPGVPVVLIAGGIGITPLLSMLRGGLAAEPARAVHLYWGVRQGAERGFRSELEEVARSNPGFHATLVYSAPGADDVPGRDFQHSGFIDVELLRRTLPAGRHRFYVCGPPAMMASLLPALGAWGVLPGDIHHEAFGPASARPAQGPAPAVATAAQSLEVMFRSSGRTLAWDGSDANLLDFAERHSVPVESGCRSGSCGSCEVKLISGQVRYAATPDHEVAPGHCLLCVGVPDGPLELEA